MHLGFIVKILEFWELRPRFVICRQAWGQYAYTARPGQTAGSQAGVRAGIGRLAPVPPNGCTFLKVLPLVLPGSPAPALKGGATAAPSSYWPLNAEQMMEVVMVFQF